MIIIQKWTLHHLSISKWAKWEQLWASMMILSLLQLMTTTQLETLVLVQLLIQKLFEFCGTIKRFTTSKTMNVPEVNCGGERGWLGLGKLTFAGGNKNLVKGEFTGGAIFPGGEKRPNFWLVRGSPPFPPVGKTLPLGDTVPLKDSTSPHPSPIKFQKAQPPDFSPWIFHWYIQYSIFSSFLVQFDFLIRSFHLQVCITSF